jgi:transcriptional regulator with XRE-family HTH domain
MSNKKIKIHEILPELLKAKGVSIRKASSETKVAQTTLNSWTKPNAKPTELDSLKAVADFLGVSLEYLLWGQKPKVNINELETDILLSGLFKIRLEKIKEP